MRPALAVFACVALLCASCSSSAAEERRVRVFAASSLAEAFQELTDAYGAACPGVELELHVAGTPQLVMQITEGVDADVFASADEYNMVRAQEAAEPGQAAFTFATNELVIAVAAGNPQSVAGLADLARKDLLVALCGPDVPAGRYAREALAMAGVQVSSISDEPSVRALLSKIELGEIDAGIVYVTDVLDGDVGSVAIASGFQVTATYPIIALRKEPGEGFVEFVLSEEGQAILAAAGFGAP